MERAIRSAVVIALCVGSFAACKGKSASSASSAPSALVAAEKTALPQPLPAAAAPARPAPTTQPPTVQGGTTDADALAFFRAQIEACNAWNVKVGNSAPGEKYFDGSDKDPTRKMRVVERLAPTKVVVEDTEGVRLLVDLQLRRISSTKGAAAALPTRYKFCSEKTFVGTSDD